METLRRTFVLATEDMKATTPLNKHYWFILSRVWKGRGRRTMAGRWRRVFQLTRRNESSEQMIAMFYSGVDKIGMAVSVLGAPLTVCGNKDQRRNTSLVHPKPSSRAAGITTQIKRQVTGNLYFEQSTKEQAPRHRNRHLKCHTTYGCNSLSRWFSNIRASNSHGLLTPIKTRASCLILSRSSARSAID